MNPIPHRIEQRRIGDLKLGFTGEYVDFSWRPYAKRTDEARADYDRLIVSLWHDGCLKPVITYKGHVLIGMRRIEIMTRLYPCQFVDCVEILEDVSRWTRDDLPRLEALKEKIGRVEY